MGSAQSGGITSRLQAIKKACLDWLTAQDRTTGTVRVDIPIDEDMTALAVSQNVESPAQPQPEALELLYKLQAFGMSFWGGSYSEQPCLLMKELLAAKMADQEYHRLTEINQLNKLRAEQQQRGIQA